LTRLTRWTISHRRLAVIGWIVLVIAISVIGSSVGTRNATSFSLPGTDSQKAYDLLQQDFSSRSGDVDQIVFHVEKGSVTAPAVTSKAEAMLKEVRSAPHVVDVTSPFGTEGAAQVSKDGRTAFATVDFDERANELPKDAIEHVIEIAEGARTEGLGVELGGQAVEQVQQPSIGFTAAIGLIAAMVVLLISFGSLVAMGMPILTALLGLGTGTGLIALFSQFIDMPEFATELAVMIGLGVGIDYSLFVVTRFRENFQRGDDVDTAVLGAMNTAGRAIVFAGCTVIIALLGMFALGISFLSGAAVASALAVATTLLAALTVLPAMLSRFGARIGGRRRGGTDAPAAARPPRATAWERWAAFIQRHPWPATLVGLAVMLALIVPVTTMREASSDAGNDPTSQTTRQAFDQLAEGFGPGFNGPLQIVAALPKPHDTAALDQVTTALEGDRSIVSVGAPQLAPNGTTALIVAYPDSAPQDSATTDLVHELRDTTLPPLAAQTGAQLLVGGVTANQVDFNHALAEKLPLFIAIVVLLSALLLMVVFRSILIPLQAALMNLLSIGASLGIVVLVFQHGFLGGLLGVEPGPIDAFVPVMVFAIVFGLSMDYEVFLISRVHEEWLGSRDASRAVARGLGSSGRVITAAATIMICVFLSFVLLDQRAIKMFGVSLSAAVFLDAFVVRSVLVPATLELLGRNAWLLPSWLERRLPRLSIESPEIEVEPQEV
jgi:putative drug exporter of the RND superfamily